MDSMMWFATLAVVLTVAHSIPQAIKVYLSNVPKAISGFSILFMVFGSLSWTLYGYFTQTEPITVAYLFLFAFNVFILFFMIQKAGVNKLRMALSSIFLMCLLIITLLYLPVPALGYYGATVSAFMAIPQGFKLIRQREATGVSGLAYLILTASSLCWVVYGHLSGNILLVLPNLLIFPTAALVYINVIKYRTTNFWYQNLSSPSH